jgi:glycosyltransferase involved in cell wall biosynthesis
MPELTLKPQLKLIVFDDMAVLSDPETRSYYNFNPSAGPALEALAENLAPPAAADRLAQAYGVSPEVAGRDLERLIDQLEAEDLLTTVPSEPGRAADPEPSPARPAGGRGHIVFLQELQHLYPYGGTAKANRWHMERLVEAGYEVSVFCDIDTPVTRTMLGCLWSQDTLVPVADRFDDAIEFDVNGVRLLALTENDLPTLEQVKRLEPTAVVLSEDRTFGRHLVAAELGVPLVWLATRPPTLPFGRHAWHRRDAATEVFMDADEVVVPNRFMAEYVRTWTGRDSRIVPSPLFVEPRPEVGPHDGFVTMFNPSEIKGVSLFLDLARALPQHRFAAVAGWSTRQEDLDRVRAQRNVTVLPPGRDITPVLDRTSVLLAPSLWAESPGLAVSESMLRGVPSVVSAVGSLPEAKRGVEYVVPVDQIEEYTEVEDSRGVMVPVIPRQRDEIVERWARTVDGLLSDRERWHDVAQASHAAAIAQRASDAAESTLLAAVENVLETAAR